VVSVHYLSFDSDADARADADTVLGQYECTRVGIEKRFRDIDCSTLPRRYGAFICMPVVLESAQPTQATWGLRVEFVCQHCFGTSLWLVSGNDNDVTVECLSCGMRSTIDRTSDSAPCAMAADLSNNPRDKLQAALNHASADPDNDLGGQYRLACRAWFARLTEGERWVVVTALAAYEQGAPTKAEEMVSQLPAAPKFPAEGQ
jgi:hypothetical protein